MKTLVFGATGYTGSLLIQLLHRHPEVSDIIPVSRSHPGEKLGTLLPHLNIHEPSKFITTEGKTLAIEEAHSLHPDVVFSCLPHGEASVLIPFISSALIIDLSADFRFTDSSIYEKIYKKNAPQTMEISVVYGLSEWFRKEIRHADLIANPGCYPTSVLIPLLPLLPVITGPIIIHAMSGISGSGKKPQNSLLFCERNESILAYNPGSSHRHHAEIKEKLQAVSSSLPPVIFNPHLVPLSQGLYSTITTTTSADRTEILSTLTRLYGESPFVHVHNEIPDLRWSRFSNRIDIGVHVERSQLTLFSAIDNLWKGASGQALQNMNIRLGFSEDTGLQ